MANTKKALILVENCFVPLDVRVWYEATTLRDDGWDVVVICPAPSDRKVAAHYSIRADVPVNLEGITVYYFTVKAASAGVLGYVAEYLTAFFAMAKWAWRVWRQGRFQVLHICNPPDIFFPLAWFYRLQGAWIVFDQHDLFPEFVSYRFRGGFGKCVYWIARATEFLTYRCAHVVITVNESYRQIALARGRVPSDRLAIVRNGPRSDTFVPCLPVPALKRGMPFLACYVGIMGHEDGVMEAIASIRHVVRDLGRQDILFALIGDGALRPLALQQIRDWGLDGLVDMPGMITDKTIIRQYLSTADVCLSPEPLTPLNARSTFIKIGEYMAMGKPVVAYDLNESRWTARDAAVYVTPGDVHGFGRAIVDLMDDPAQRLAMGTRGRNRFLETLRWEHQKENLLAVYRATPGVDWQVEATADTVGRWM